LILGVVRCPSRPQAAYDPPAIQQCLAAAAASSEPVKVVFPKGVYQLGTAADTVIPTRALLLSNASQVVIDGQGSTLLITDPLLGFLSVENSQQVIIENMVIDYQTLPWISGTVTALDATTGSFELKLDKNQPWPADPVAFMNHTRSSAPWGYLQNPAIAGRLKAGVYNVYFLDAITQLDSNHLRIQIKMRNVLSRDFAIGDAFTMVVRQYGQGFFFKSTVDVTAQNITIHALIGAPFVGMNSQRTAILNN
jgi:hypothetical protein